MFCVSYTTISFGRHTAKFSTHIIIMSFGTYKNHKFQDSQGHIEKSLSQKQQKEHKHFIIYSLTWVLPLPSLVTPYQNCQTRDRSLLATLALHSFFPSCLPASSPHPQPNLASLVFLGLALGWESPGAHRMRLISLTLPHPLHLFLAIR